MSTLTRDDGVQFVIQAYRELVKSKKKSSIAEQIRKISEQQGQFVRLFKKRSNEYEAVFSTEPGYLLGETIKQYFQQTTNLLFFEAIPNNTQQILLVIIQNGNVFADSILDITKIGEELLPLTTLSISFDAVVTGNIPALSRENLRTQFEFPNHFINSIEHLTEQLLPRLPNLPTVRLLPLPLALRSEHLNGAPLLSLSSFLSIVLLAAVTLFISNNLHKISQPIVKPQPTPLQEYYLAQHSPEPGELITVLQNKLKELYLLEGWQVSHVSLRDNTFTASLNSIGGTFHQLENWAQQHQFHVELRTEGVYLTTTQTFNTRRSIQPPRAAQSIVENLLDMLNRSFLEINTNLNQIINHPQSKEIQITIHLVDLTPNDLVLLNRILANSPVVLKSVDFALNADSLQNGTVELSVWGN